MSGETTLETKELTLVGKVEFRIASADLDSKLESLLNTYLAPLLLKLASEHQSVRNKVRGDLCRILVLCDKDNDDTDSKRLLLYVST